MHIEQEFTTWTHILVHTGDANVYGCLWTQPVYVPDGLIFLFLFMFFFLIIISKTL